MGTIGEGDTTLLALRNAVNRYFNPSTVGFLGPLSIAGIRSWYDAKDTNQLLNSSGLPVTSVGEKIETWTDKIASGIDVTNSVVAEQPEYTLNGVDFTTDNSITLVNVGATDFDDVYEHTLFTVLFNPEDNFDPPIIRAFAYVWSYGSGTNDGFGIFVQLIAGVNPITGVQVAVSDALSSFVQVPESTVDSQGSTAVYTSRLKNNKLELWKNDIKVNEKDYAASEIFTGGQNRHTLGGWLSGQNLSYNGKLGDMILYDRGLTDEELSDMITWLRNKFSI